MQRSGHTAERSRQCGRGMPVYRPTYLHTRWPGRSPGSLTSQSTTRPSHHREHILSGATYNKPPSLGCLPLHRWSPMISSARPPQASARGRLQRLPQAQSLRHAQRHPNRRAQGKSKSINNTMYTRNTHTQRYIYIYIYIYI